MATEKALAALKADLEACKVGRVGADFDGDLKTFDRASWKGKCTSDAPFS